MVSYLPRDMAPAAVCWWWSGKTTAEMEKIKCVNFKVIVKTLQAFFGKYPSPELLTTRHSIFHAYLENDYYIFICKQFISDLVTVFTLHQYSEVILSVMKRNFFRRLEGNKSFSNLNETFQGFHFTLIHYS